MESFRHVYFAAVTTDMNLWKHPLFPRNRDNRMDSELCFAGGFIPPPGHALGHRWPSLVMSILPLSNPASWRFCCEAWSLIALDLGACTSQLAALCAQLGAKHVLAVDAGTSPATAFAKLKRIRSTSPRPQQRSHDPGILLYNAVLQHSPKNCDSEKSDLIQIYIGHHLRLLSWSREPRSALLCALFPSVGRYLLRGL